MYNPHLAPTDIQLKKASALLDIDWADGSHSQLSGLQLRQYCACSRCRARNRVGVSMVTDNNTIENLNLIGAAGLQIIFADGHDRGVFPWGYLRAIAEGRAREYLDD